MPTKQSLAYQTSAKCIHKPTASLLQTSQSSQHSGVELAIDIEHRVLSGGTPIASKSLRVLEKNKYVGVAQVILPQNRPTNRNMTIFGITLAFLAMYGNVINRSVPSRDVFVPVMNK